MPRCGCGSSGSCDCQIIAGPGIGVSGQGTDASPYFIRFVGTPEQPDVNGVRHGIGPPPDNLGIEGDFYIDSSNKVVYGPKRSSGWGEGTSMVGPAGPQGPKGDQGPQGLPGAGAIPSGSVFYFGGATIPVGWLVCDGSAVSRTTYATLFAAIGTVWGAGDGSTTFNLPSLVGRFALGVNAGTGGQNPNSPLGATLNRQTVILANANIPPHVHSIAHNHTITARDTVTGVNPGMVAAGGGSGSFNGSNTAVNGVDNSVVTGDGGGASGLAGQSFPITPSFAALYAIIKT